MGRRDPGADPHLDIKIALFFVGAIVGLAGMYLQRPAIIMAAIAIIAAGLLLRFLPSNRPGGADGESEEPTEPRRQDEDDGRS